MNRTKKFVAYILNKHTKLSIPSMSLHLIGI